MKERYRPWRLLIACIAALVFGLAAAEPSAVLEVSPMEATLGDPLAARLTVTVDAGEVFEPPRIGPELGPFVVLSGSWKVEPESEKAGPVHVWEGTLGAYEIGSLELPPVAVAEGLTTESLTIEIVSVLEETEDPETAVEIADLKAPQSIEADLRPLYGALGALLGLLVIAAVLWWLHRRYGARLAAAPSPTDPFHRTPPHVWIYGELRKLMERHLAEQGQIDLFYAELSWLLKRYLSGRYRVELMEHTSEELPGLLKQAGADRSTIDSVRALITEADQVKFALERPGSESWRRAVEAVYGIVDATKPVESGETTPARGAA